MGCDIHMYVEYRRNGDWKNGDYFMLDNPDAIKPKRKRMELYDARNYDLFAVLANVRNYDLREYIDDPRGLPDDVTYYVEHEYEDWGWDAHSCSYFTLQELIDFDEEHEPRSILGRHILRPLIDRLKQRADELRLIYDFEWDREQSTQELRDKANNIRIVFWFDN